jgi:hypothetical protein
LREAHPVKMLAEYLDTAIKFEQMAAHEIDPNSRQILKGKPPLIASSRKREPRNTVSKCPLIGGDEPSLMSIK